MKKEIHKIILTLNKILLLHITGDHSILKNISKPCGKRIDKTLNNLLDLLENILADATESLIPSLCNIDADKIEQVAKFYSQQLLPLINKIGTMVSHASSLVTAPEEQIALLEKANQLFDIIYIEYLEQIYSNQSFLVQYGKTKYALAEKLLSFGFEEDAQQLHLRARAIIELTDTEVIHSDLKKESSVTTYHEAA